MRIEVGMAEWAGKPKWGTIVMFIGRKETHLKNWDLSLVKYLRHPSVHEEAPPRFLSRFSSSATLER